MSIRIHRLMRVLALPATLFAGNAAAGQADPAETLLRERLEAPGIPGPAGEPLLAAEAVRGYYRTAGFRLLWSPGGGAGRAADELIAFVEQVAGDGLRPEEYHLGSLKRLRALAAPVAPQQRAELEMLLTDAFLGLGQHLLHGRVDPRLIHPAWNVGGRSADLGGVMLEAVQRNRVGAALTALRPATGNYARLRDALTRYRAYASAGGWQTLPARTRSLRPGDSLPDVAVLRRRISLEAWLPEGGDSMRYDSALVGAVRVFQRRHGLGDDGVVGQGTRAALNASAELRVHQLEASLERERWMPSTLGQRYIAVFIPAFELQAVDSGRVALGMRVIAGKPSWRTPIFSGQMTSVIFNPYWNIPPSIWTREVAPRAAREPGYLSSQGIQPVTEGGRTRWRQVPGPANPLGEVKMLFPNRFNVYLHDTSSRSLFRRDERALSHGCIRVESPLALAAFALSGTTGWNPDRVEGAAEGDTERGVRLSAPLPVYIFYRTAWVEETGAVQFRPDVYDHDSRLADALAGRRVRPQRDDTVGEG